MTVPLLAIDTSGARLQLAIFRDGELFESVDEREKGHAEVLFPQAALLLGKAGIAYEDLKRVAVITGPGSFSGLRIGLSAARGLGLALSIPVVGVPRLLALSLSAAKKTGPIGVLLDARRDEAYCEIFPAAGAPGDGPLLMPVSAARTRLAECREIVETPFVKIGKTARFAATLDPADYPPVPAYIRDADAKPQDGARIARAKKAR